MDNSPIATRKEVSSLLGKVLLAKQRLSAWDLRMNTGDGLPLGALVYVLAEGKDEHYNLPQARFLYNGVPGRVLVDNYFDSQFAILEPDDRLKGKIFVFTGALTNTREYFKTLVECFGGVVGSSVTAKTDYLVVGDATFQGDANHKSTKAKKAATLGVPVVNEQGFYKLIKG